MIDVRQIACLMFLALGSGVACAQRVGDTVTITLRSRVETPHELVAMRDLAVISGGPERTRSEIADLDISELEHVGDQDVISGERISYRLLLNGYGKNEVKVVGRSVAVQRRGDYSSDELVMKSIRPALADAFHVAPNDLDLRFTRPINKLTESLDSGSVLKPFPPEKPRLGAVSMHVGIYSENNLVTTIPVNLQVRLLRSVPVARSTLSPRDVLSADDIEWTRLPVATRDLFEQDAELTGRVLRRRITPGQVLRPADVSTRSNAANSYVIQSRSPVRLIARKGELRVVMGGAVSMQRGKIGQTIRFQNPSTRKIIFAKIIDSNTAEIRL